MNDIAARIESVLLRCWIWGFVLLIVWTGAILLLSEQILTMHAELFGLSLHEVQIVMYSGLGIWKLGVLLFFFIPWLSLRMMRKPAAS